MSRRFVSLRSTSPPSVSRSGAGSRMGAAEPIITGSGALGAGGVDVATMRGPGSGAVSEEPSCRGVPLRAESAANGDTKLGRAAGEGSGRRVSGLAEWLPTMAGRDGVRGAAVAFGAAVTSLKSCSMGKRRWACAILSRPSSRWKRCSCLYPSSPWVRSMICR